MAARCIRSRSHVDAVDGVEGGGRVTEESIRTHKYIYTYSYVHRRPRVSTQL
jgi:hypothetical protein